MKHILILLLLIPNLSWALTFSNGKQVNNKQAINKYLDSEYSFVPDTDVRWSEPTGNLTRTYAVSPLTSANTPYAHAWVNDIVRDGDHAIRLELRGLECFERDCPRGDFKGWAGRTEFGFSDAKLTGENWFRWSVYIPKETDHLKSAVTKWNGTMFMQFKTSSKADVHDGCPLIPFNLKLGINGISIFRDTGDIDVRGECFSEHDLIMPNSRNFKGKWLDFVLHNKWSDSNDGFMNLWINGNKVWSHQGVNLVKASNQYPPIMRFPIYNIKRHPEQDKNSTQVIYYDAFYSAKTCEKMNIESLGYNCKDFK